MNSVSSSRITTLANALLVACALVMTSLVVRAELRPKLTAIANEAPEKQPDWQSYAVAGHRFGRADAPVTLIEFADFECPACRLLNTRFHDLLARRPNDVAILYRHMPLPIHRFANLAATASECAARQNRFEAMHDSLFANQSSLGLKPWSELAAGAGVSDTALFVRCMKDSSVAVPIGVDEQAFTKLGSHGTPTLLIHGLRFVGVPSAKVLDSLIDLSLLEHRSPTASRQ